VLDASPAHRYFAHIVGAENSVKIGTLETVGAEIDYDGLGARRAERIDDVNFPGADNACDLSLGGLQQRIIFVLGNSGKAAAPAEFTRMLRIRRCDVESTRWHFSFALFFSIWRQSVLSQPPRITQAICQSSINSADRRYSFGPLQSPPASSVFRHAAAKNVSRHSCSVTRSGGSNGAMLSSASRRMECSSTVPRVRKSVHFSKAPKL
jgi:hypothetical protein